MPKQFTQDHTFIAKGAAILLLLAYHLNESEFTVAVLGVNYSPLPLSAFLQITGFGNICVAMFVFLTAFGISSGIFAQTGFNAQAIYKKATQRFFTLMFNFSMLYVSTLVLWLPKLDFSSVYGIGKQSFLNMLFDALGLGNLAGTPTVNVTWWYMKLAYILIFLIPLLAYITKKIGYPILLLTLLLPAVIQVDADLQRYLFTAVLGVCAAYGKWLDKLMNVKIPLYLQWIVSLIGLAVCIVVRQHPFIRLNYLYLADAPICLFMLYFTGILLAGIPVLKNILHFLGKHSMNIFLVHTFFYLLLWQEWIYSFKYAGLILLVLLLVSLAYSIVLEMFKKWLASLYKKVTKKNALS